MVFLEGVSLSLKLSQLGDTHIDSIASSLWHFDLDRIFAEFESETYGQQLNTGFITRRLQEQLPPVARSILAWASLLGNTFSFACIQRLLSGEFSYSDNLDQDAPTCPAKAALFTPDSPDNAVQGLQACLQAYVGFKLDFTYLQN